MRLSDLTDRMVVHESLPVPIDRRLRRLAWTGTVLLAVFASYLTIAGRLVDVSRRPRLFLIGWGVVVDTMELGGHALTAGRVGAGALAGAVLLAALTGGYRSAPAWAQVASLVVGLAGVLAALPLAVALAVCVANLILWVALGLLAFAIGSAILFGLASAAADP